MKLSTKIQHMMLPQALREGESLYTLRKAVPEVTESGFLLVRFDGPPVCQTGVQYQRKVLLVGCTCPAFGNECCGHVWATLLEAEQSNLIPEVRDREMIYLDLDPDFSSSVTTMIDTPLPKGLGNLLPELFSLFGTPPAKGPLAGLFPQQKAAKASAPALPPPPTWKNHLTTVKQSMTNQPLHIAMEWPAHREILYMLDVAKIRQTGIPAIEVFYRERKANGTWGKPKQQKFGAEYFPFLPDPEDRQILTFLLGNQHMKSSPSSYYGGYGQSSLSLTVPEPALGEAFRMLCASRRFHLTGTGLPDFLETPLTWDEDQRPWQFFIKIRLVKSAKNECQIEGWLRRGEAQMGLANPTLLLAGGFVITHDTISPLDHGEDFSWVSLLRKTREIRLPEAEVNAFVQETLQLPYVPALELPEAFQFSESLTPPQLNLVVRNKRIQYEVKDRLFGEVSFEYPSWTCGVDDTSGGSFDPKTRSFHRRDRHTEKTALDRLREVGFRKQELWESQKKRILFEIAPQQLSRAIFALTQDGWKVEAEGKIYRQAKSFSIGVTSGVDWFELKAQADFEGQSASLPALLAALRRGENFVRLDDGTFGMLPEAWLKKYGVVAGLGETEADVLKFRRSQAGILDALLATQPEATCDAQFEHLRNHLRAFDKIEAKSAPPGFVGTLRHYQEEGLGWMCFLQEFGLNGCLADDMGLGKTVQVLALLELLRLRKETEPDAAPRSSLVVVPRSLIFNWKQEAARFAPQLKVLNHTGAGRDQTMENFADYDLVLTTYGTMLRDVTRLKDTEFDYVILDEAQAIKNSAAETTKAARLLKSRHRLAMSGTPVENHLGELWSLFEFLNPGMLGSAAVFQAAGIGTANVDEESRRVLAKALRPFILRRTKQQVAPELPPKVEQTIFCELEVEQRQQYDELREHYRATLLKQVDQTGLNKAKMQILEALLRLRQAACHPGLIDKKQTGKSSAKLDALLPQLLEVLEENHKVLVFSQFTSFLAILKDRLKKEKITFEYLDGKTRDRETLVHRFQTDPDCKLFLISLKAGGLGLNLTAAEYVFLLDPWWNPAVEAQAIDRTHRIGQTEHVFAYRLITRDTVEEKVLALQQTKRALADAIISEDNSLIRDLGREDLELLLS
ncbi:MAG: DEAD/DEAH box helicase [Blastocatellia bacterium]|nr:DEAD/DEAH box helicase [Blastocatellia bacterium]